MVDLSLAQLLWPRQPVNTAARGFLRDTAGEHLSRLLLHLVTRLRANWHGVHVVLGMAGVILQTLVRDQILLLIRGR